MKKVLTGVGALIVSGIALYLGALGGWGDVREWVVRWWTGGPSILVIAPTRPDAREFFAAERLRFKIKNATPSIVSWLFDDANYHRGNVEAEFAFQYDEAQPPLVANHTVVAVFRNNNGKYTATEKDVSVTNVRLVTSAHSAEGSKVSLVLPTTVLDGWSITSASLALLQDGAYQPFLELPLTPTGEKSTAATKIDPTLVEGAKDRWVTVSYEFGVSGGGAGHTLTFVRPLEDVPGIHKAISEVNAATHG